MRKRRRQCSVGLERHFGWDDSQVIREGIKILNRLLAPAGRRVKGLGRFSSGVPNLGSNNSYLKRFGR